MKRRVAHCTADDLEKLLGRGLPPHVADHHRERFALQCHGAATYLLAWRDSENVGRATLFYTSKYEAVRRRHPRTAEINALSAYPQGHGTGTALITAAESVAVQRGHGEIGLAVALTNSGARRLHARLGYEPWVGDQVVDEWTERRGDGLVVRSEDCDYLIKSLSRLQI